MAVFKCKMCGGAMQITDQGFGQCPYCGTTQTFPKLDDERRAQMYERANEFRRLNEYDKAFGIFEQILSENPTDAEAYWSVLLCTYGVEYVEDPRSHKRIPTVNRAQFTSIFSDSNYAKALENADEIQKQIYVAEATAIDNIQKGILEVSSKEEPFDVFICYKETDDNGLRTQDSVYAYDIYDALKDKGYRVFFSRITLENKLGTAFEPYIFAALNSAKVMLVVGTKKEYFNAVWVKNEWARYIALMKTDKSKCLIPIYKDIDPTDLPEEFSYLQAQDMSKIGFMQDIVHGVEKLIPKTTAKWSTASSSNATNPTVDSYLKRAFLFIEDADWKSASEYCEKVLDIEPENADAYLGKFLVDYKLKSIDELDNLKSSFVDNNNYKKIVRFGSAELNNQLEEYLSHINKKIAKVNEEAKLNKMLLDAIKSNDISSAKTLIDVGANVNARVQGDTYTDSFLLEAIIKSHVEMVRLLIANGADPNSERIFNHGSRYSVLRDSIAEWPNEEIAEILVNAGADVNYVSVVKGLKSPILVSAISSQNVNIVRMLLSHGANPNCERILENGKHTSALKTSVYKNNPALVETLLSYGARCLPGELNSFKMSRAGLSLGAQAALSSMGVIFS